MTAAGMIGTMTAAESFCHLQVIRPWICRSFYSRLADGLVWGIAKRRSLHASDAESSQVASAIVSLMVPSLSRRSHVKGRALTMSKVRPAKQIESSQRALQVRQTSS
eukprot:gnl/TRDRNA2_/TRDRNA2_167249_c0_seq2.p1 gnl/TRDRNA2_/TRDRNA2_167249_c0~~gnl/TRDRNA2_/TRDRNA2_167249_c0_seq2.p1  ORF type:complete len:121 (+),score=3.89 gnl/TRDRNA2_/TRDRNA2_167249_c0_seq2:44-364(+)